MPADNKALIREWFDEVWNKKREAAEGWNAFDQLGMLQQLGVVRLPG
jgi:hypothetical protein